MGSAPISMFWWSPRASLRLLWGERRRMSSWIRSVRAGDVAFRNFGDELSPRVVEWVTGREVVWAPPRRADLVAVGSVLELVLERGFGGVIWGTGLRGPVEGELAEKGRACQVVAVRGEWTRSSLGLGVSVPLGDPGLFSRVLLHAEIGQSTRPVFIPHFSAMWSDGRDALGARFRVVRPTLPAAVVIGEVAAAPWVLSESLHGVVVAHSVGIPAVLLRDESGSSETDWKYADYLSALGIQIPIIGLDEIADSRVLDARVELARALRIGISEKVELLLGPLRENLREALG